MKKTFFAALMLFVMIPAALHAVEVSQVPNPMATSGGFVMDQGHVLGTKYVQLLNELSSAIKTDGGAELAVVTVDNMAGLTVDEYAVKLFERFKIGNKGKDDGILILMSRDDQKIKIEVGYGLEGVFNDALAGRLIDENTIPNFKKDQFGKGIYLLARAIAEKEAASRNKKLSLPMPVELPTQVALPENQESEKGALAKPENLNNILLTYSIIIFSLTLFSLTLLSIRVLLKKAKAARAKVIDGPVTMLFLQWIGGGAMIFVVAGMQKKYLLPIAVYLSSSIIVTVITVYARRFMKMLLKYYRISCKTCLKPMRLISEDEDDKFLNPEEVAEEKACGMDYEFWVCDTCKKTERFNVRMDGANKCPKCKRLTLKEESQVLEKATEQHSGREKITRTCLNPACGFHDEEEKQIPKKTSSNSDQSGNDGSGGGSFGGGKSGGGGASRGW